MARALVNDLERYDEKPPTFALIDISLSFKIIIIFFLNTPILFKASKAIPPVKAPSPITATAFPSLFNIEFARVMPIAEDIEVLAWPEIHVSYILSSGLEKPLIPLYCLSV